VSYQWTAPRGSFDSATVLHPVYTAPTTCGIGEVVILTLTVTNEHEISARDSLVVRVTDTIQCAFPATCPASIPCRASMMSPSRPEASHPHVLPRPTPVCVPPAPIVRPPVTVVCVPAPEARPCPIPCSVPCAACPEPLPPTRPNVCSPPCPVPCSMCPQPLVSTCPTVCPAACSTKSIVEGGSIQLRGSVWDPDYNLTGYYWSADKGRFDDQLSLNPIYFAPMTANPCGEDVYITLTAIDSCGATTVSRIILHIENANQPPQVNADP